MSDEVIAAAKSRLGDVGAMVRLMQPLNASGGDPVLRKRRLVADLCRLIGEEMNGNGEPHVAVSRNSNGNGNGHNGDSTTGMNGGELPPRLQQTLKSLLAGDSEKQVAKKLGLSRHTVHVYVKSLYKRFGVCSRGELLARWVR
jgi:DNA-binding NarL/FixJ family response regulator